jgi:DNA repair protein SbcC/Rad50
MRPLKLTVEGLRSIRSEVEVDFTGRDNIAIIGDTGAGKSSLLQAITYALYGRPTYSGQANQELMNDSSTQLRVVLEFIVAGERWKVARTLRRAGDGKVMPGNALLVRLADDDTAVEQFEQVRPVNERLESLLGLDFDAFTRAVLLPQGEFAKLLVDDRPTARSAILQQIWRTDELTSLGNAAQLLAREIMPLLAKVEQQLSGEPPDPQAHLADLGRRRKEAAAAAEQAGKDHGEAMQAAAELEIARTHHSAAKAVTESLTEDPPKAHAVAAAALATAAVEATGWREDLQGQLERLRTNLADVPDNADGLDATGVATARSRLPELATTLGEELGEQRSLEAQAQEAWSEAREAQTLATRLREQAQARAEGRGDLVETKRLADVALHTATVALAHARSAARTATEWHKDALIRAAEADTDAGEAQTAEQLAEELARPVELLNAELDDHRRAEAAAGIAHGLHAGEDCPVCERELPDDWQPPAGSSAVEATAAALETARAKLTRAHTNAIRLRTDATTAQRTADDAHKTARHAAETARLRRGELADLLDVSTDEIDLDADDEVLLEPLAGRCRAAADAVAAYDAATGDLEVEASSHEATAGRASVHSADLESRAQASGTRATKAFKSMRELLALLPDGLEDLALPEELDRGFELPDLGPAYTFLDEREEVLTARADSRRELRVQIEQVEVHLRTLEEQLESTLHAPARTLSAKLDTHRDALAAAFERLRAVNAAPEVTLPALAATCEPADLPQLVERSTQVTDVLLAAADALKVAANERGKQAREVTDRLAASVELPDGRAADELVRLLDERQRDLDHTSRTAKSAATTFEQRVGPLVELARAKGELARVCALVTDLAAALQPSRFPKWLTLRRSRSLLVYASKLLGEMTGDRYAFADLDDETSEWRIVDADTGTPRSPQSLSGGEQFIASLALALGIVEMMARSGGRLESLWLDEGFGALDRSNLDLAVQALASVSAGGRMVAVITHVQAVAEQVEHVLAVTRSSTGTEVDWLTASQRLDAADGELTEELSGAVAGLLP